MGWLWQATGLFVATNVDDLIVLALFFAQARVLGHGGRAVVIGQYLGFAVILAGCLLGAVGLGQLPGADLRYLGVVPILLGCWTGWRTWRDWSGAGERPPAATSWWTVALVTMANSGDNVGAYLPAFAGRSAGVLAGFTVVFLVLVGAWCLAGLLLTAHPAVTAAVRRWGAVLTPAALVVIGLLIIA